MSNPTPRTVVDGVGGKVPVTPNIQAVLSVAVVAPVMARRLFVRSNVSALSSVTLAAPDESVTRPSVNEPVIPPPPPCVVHVSVAVHPRRFEPAVASVSKKHSPTEHVAGAVVPSLHGFVESALPASKVSPAAAVSAAQSPEVHDQTSVMSPEPAPGVAVGCGVGATGVAHVQPPLASEEIAKPGVGQVAPA